MKGETTMIIGINYTNDGERYIAYMQYDYSWSRQRLKDIAEYLTDEYDEVYVMGFNCNYKELIKDVVLRGCRI